MVKGFETYTAPLTAPERESVAPRLARLLQWRKGRAVAIKNQEIRDELRKIGYNVSDAKVRALINYIRINGLVERLVASIDGYYVAESGRELAEYCDSLREREAAIRAVRQALEGQNNYTLF